MKPKLRIAGPWLTGAAGALGLGVAGGIFAVIDADDSVSEFYSAEGTAL